VIGTAYFRYKTPALIAHNYAPAHSVSGLTKDYDLMDLTAAWLTTPIPITALVRQQLRAAVGRGDGALDMTALLEQYLRYVGATMSKTLPR
jgi:3-hydroxyisobutyrate dehydrogenase-like beta-hydroxyacid dehydrogenase